MTGEILIDTSTLIDFFQGAADIKTKEILSSSELTISVITFGELYKFLLKTGKTKLWETYKSKLEKYKLIEVTQKISERAAELAYMHGLSMADSLIYSTALENNLTLL
ncbi:MAG: PIN domain-containing protein, partial [Candidatus Micrarchaeota archaeon]